MGNFITSANTTVDVVELSQTAVNQMANSIFLMTHPVGSIYMSTTTTNPGTLYGGTWIKIEEGRTLIGSGSNGTSTYINGATGGSVTTTHTHSGDNLKAHYGAYNSNARAAGYDCTPGDSTWPLTYSIGNNAAGYDAPAVSPNHFTPISGNVVDTSISTLQPYKTCSIWKRTA